MNLLYKLSKIAGILDQKGHYDLADDCDHIVRRAAEYLSTYKDPEYRLGYTEKVLERVKENIQKLLGEDPMNETHRSQLMWLLRKEKELTEDIESRKGKKPTFEWRSDEKDIEEIKNEIDKVKQQMAAGEKYDEDHIPLDSGLEYLEDQLEILTNPERAKEDKAYSEAWEKQIQESEPRMIEDEATPPDPHPEEGMLDPSGYVKYYE
jgi:hypothetical protein